MDYLAPINSMLHLKFFPCWEIYTKQI